MSRAGENNSYALLGKQGVCIYKRLKPTVPGDAGNLPFFASVDTDALLAK